MAMLQLSKISETRQITSGTKKNVNANLPFQQIHHYCKYTYLSKVTKVGGNKLPKWVIHSGIFVFTDKGKFIK